MIVEDEKIIIDLVEYLDDRGAKTWTISFPAGTVRDQAGNNFIGRQGYAFKLKDSTSPVIESFLPLHLDMNVTRETDITLFFSEHVQAGVGNIILTPSDGNGIHTVVYISSADTSQVMHCCC